MATLQEKLDDAEAAYHELSCGRSARVIVDRDGQRVEFSAANRTGLYAYIQSLKAQLAAATRATPTDYSPMGVVF